MTKKETKQSGESAGILAAVYRSQAVIEFELDGTIITANDNFLEAMGYSLGEIRGKHHRIFVDPEYAGSPEYKAFWKRLGKGGFDNGEFKRLNKDGGEVWIQASYSAVFDEDGDPTKVVKVATDITKQKIESTQLKAAVGGASTAIMIINRDFEIVYANEATLSMLRANEQELRSLFPGFSADTLVGTCIDIFHRDPAHQRNLLANPQNLPYRTDIQVGSLRFEIVVSAVTDVDGNYIGSTMEWTEVSQKREQETAMARLSSAVDGAGTAIMMINRDFEIVYANDSTKDMLKENEAELRSVFPSFRADALIGTCIDVFHKDPSHQRRMLEDPSNLPYRTDIQVGSLRFEIAVRAVMDPAGNYIGNTMEWTEVTEKRKQETAVARLSAAVDGASTALMMINRDFEIVYANQATKDMLAAKESEVRSVFPGFRADALIGTCIDDFHKNPAHQRRLLENPGNLPYHTDIAVGDLRFAITVSPIFDGKGEYIGNTMEWTDVTVQRDAQKQIDTLLAGAISGELDGRIDTANYDGFLKELGDNINRLIEAIVQPLSAVKNVAGALSAGDLSQSMQGEFGGEFGQLASSMNTSVENLRRMVSQITEAASNINEGASDISQGNTNLSDRTQQQASALEETAAAVEEMTTTVKQNAQSAQEARKLAADASSKATKGGEVVSNAVDAMTAINQSSKKISDIIGVIDEIAFQTNLLALNAAVEAARAGEQGRGFAVVASEVRNLAQRSAKAAKEIKKLINDSVEKVGEGTKLVDESGATLEQIVDAVKKVSELVAEISTASDEQAQGIEQVNKAIGDMDGVTQQNAALVEEAAAASQSMDEQATQLARLIGFFSLDGNRSNGHAGGPQAHAPIQSPASTSKGSNGHSANSHSNGANGHNSGAFAVDPGNEWAEF